MNRNDTPTTTPLIENRMDLVTSTETTMTLSQSMYSESTQDNTHPFERNRPKGVQLFVIMTSIFIVSANDLPAFFSAFSLFLLIKALVCFSTALPVIASEFNALDEIEWVGTAYILPMTAFQPLFGKLSDIFGRRFVLLCCVALFTISSGLVSMSGNMLTLCAMRGFQGMGAAGISPVVIITIADLIPLGERAKYQGMVSLCWATGSLAGPLLGGVLADQVGWRWIFYMNIPVGVIVLVIFGGVLRLPFSSSVGKSSVRLTVRQGLARIDILGAICFVGCVMCALLATQWGGVKYPWSSTVVIGLYSASATLFGAMLLVITHIDTDPIIAPWMFKSSANISLYIMTFTFCMAMFMNIYYLPIYFQIAHGDTPTRAGVEVLPYLLSVDIASILAGFVVSKCGKYQPMFWMGTILVLIGGCLQSLLSVASGTGEQVAFLITSGVGVGLCVQNVYVAAQENADHKDLATAISLASFFENFGFVSGVSIGGVIFTNTLAYYLESLQLLTDDQIQDALKSPDFIKQLPEHLKAAVSQAYASALRWIFVSIAVCGAIAFLCSFVMKLSKKKVNQMNI